MDIRKWPIDKIMQLPDWCFGSRWQIISSRDVAADTTDEWLAKPSLPEYIVLWRIAVTGYVNGGVRNIVKFAIGDHEPASDAEFDEFERIFKGDLENAVAEGGIMLHNYVALDLRMRMPIHSMGRNFAVQFTNGHETGWSNPVFSFEISSFPTEVPDWLISGLDNVL